MSKRLVNASIVAAIEEYLMHKTDCYLSLKLEKIDLTGVHLALPCKTLREDEANKVFHQMRYNTNLTSVERKNDKIVFIAKAEWAVALGLAFERTAG